MSEVKNADFVLLEFTTEDKEQISSVLKAYQNGYSPELNLPADFCTAAWNKSKEFFMCKN